MGVGGPARAKRRRLTASRSCRRIYLQPERARGGMGVEGGAQTYQQRRAVPAGTLFQVEGQEAALHYLKGQPESDRKGS